MLNLKKPEEFIGSPWKYYTFRFLSLLQVLLGLGVLILGILITSEEGFVDWYSMGYMVSGLVTLILALFSHATYSSTCRLGAFLFILFLCFCAVLGLSLAVSLLKSSIDLYGSENGEIIEYSLFGASGLLFLEFIFGSWYFSSVKDFEIEKENMNLLTRSH